MQKKIDESVLFRILLKLNFLKNISHALYSVYFENESFQQIIDPVYVAEIFFFFLYKDKNLL